MEELHDKERDLCQLKEIYAKYSKGKNITTSKGIVLMWLIIIIEWLYLILNLLLKWIILLRKLRKWKGEKNNYLTSLLFNEL